MQKKWHVSVEGVGYGRCCDGNYPNIGVDRPLVCALVFAVLFVFEEERWYRHACIFGYRPAENANSQWPTKGPGAHFPLVNPIPSPQTLGVG
jgi:hypothetical protein